MSPASQPIRQGSRAGRGLPVVALALTLIGAAALAWWWFQGRRPRAPVPQPTHVGSAACADCHAAEHERWNGSHHQRAMLLPTEENVLGDFENSTYAHRGVTTRFARRGPSYIVSAEGPDGRPAEYAVKYVIGVDPVQQYVVEFPGGKLQCLTVAWDVRGRRWYSLYPGQRIATDDPLHWTGRYQNWNLMCGECHTTGYRKGYDAAADSYRTQWAEFDVGCEACHGPGGGHVAWARKHGKPAGYRAASGQTSRRTSASMGLVANLRSAAAQVDGCAPCHSRRHWIGAEHVPGAPLLDAMMPELIRAPHYHADGQMLDEVYEYGSFRQSKMYQRGVRCSDCHDPHSGRTKAEGNALCVSCHGEKPNPAFPTLVAKAYDSPTHHFHPPGTPAAQCVSCHMTSGKFMVVDERRDHFFRVPRPDESERWGTPNACTSCHVGRPAAWAAEAVRRWYGSDRPTDSRFVEAVAGGRAGEPEAGAKLRAVATDTARTAIARATALDLLRSGDTETSAVLAGAMADPDPLVRATAVAGLDALPSMRRIALGAPLLRDPVRAVRIQAARVLAPVPVNLFTREQRRDLAAATSEYRTGLNAVADMPSTYLNLGVLEADLGRIDLAEQAYLRALSMDPYFVPARQNLATAYNEMGRNADAERELREGVRHAPDQGELHYSLGLLLAEEGRLAEAATSLRAAARLLPYRARVQYNLGLTLQRLGRTAEAEKTLLAAAKADAGDPEIAFAVAALYANEGRWTEALPYAERFEALSPSDQRAAALLQEVRRALGAR